MLKHKPLGVALITTLTIVCGAVLIWTLTPIESDPDSADTSVAFANRHAPVFREAYFEHKGHSLHYVDAGRDGDDIVLFIHGFPSYWFSFIRQMKALKNDYRVIAVDGLGAGKSDAPGNIGAYGLEAMTTHMNALVDHLDTDRIHLVGHDWGAALAFGFAQRYPERVRTVTGLSAPPQSVILELLETNASQRQVFAYIERLKKANPVLLLTARMQSRIWENAYKPLVTDSKLSPEEGDLFRQATGNPKRINAHINWYRANIPTFDKIEDSDYWPSRKARVTVPALFIWGRDDRIITPAAIDEMLSISEDLDLLPLPGVGHWPLIEEADTVTAAIRALLSEHGRNDN